MKSVVSLRILNEFLLAHFRGLFSGIHDDECCSVIVLALLLRVDVDVFTEKPRRLISQLT